MLKKLGLVAVAVCAFGFASAPRLQAGTEMLSDNSAPAYNPPPRPVYYAPPPVRVVAYPAFRYCPRPVRAFAYYRFRGHRAYCRPHFRR